MQSGCRKKEHQEKKHLLSQRQLKHAFITGAALNIELHPRKINVPEDQ